MIKEERGGFTATLALMLAIIAIIISLLAYQRAGGKTEQQITALKAKIAELKKGEKELREKLATILEKITGSIKEEESAGGKGGK